MQKAACKLQHFLRILSPDTLCQIMTETVGHVNIIIISELVQSPQTAVPESPVTV